MPRLVRFIGRLAVALAVAGGFTLFLAWFWRLIGGGSLSLHGWIAMGLGIAGTVGLAWVLMALAFRSDRDGWDDRVDNRLDPGREGED
jgi:hypothetical protein